MIRHCSFLFILTAFFMLFPCGFCAEHAAGSDNASEPHLVFKKTVVVKPYRGGQAYTEQYRIQEGEHLWKILREHYRLPNKKIAFYCKIAGAVNPGIKDINNIPADQNILVPYEYVKGENRPPPPAQEPPPPAQEPPPPAQEPSPPATVYTVRADEHLGKILRTIYRVPEETLFTPQTFRLLQEANPGIRNLNRLVEGMKIQIPPELLVYTHPSPPAETPKSVVQKTEVHTDKTDVQKKSYASVSQVQPERHHGNVKSVADGLALLQETELPYETVSPGLDTPAEERVKNFIASFTRAFHGSAKQEGKEVLPINDRGAVTIDYSSFPVYEFPWGSRVLLDYGSRLPAAIKDVVSSEWKNAEIVAVRDRDDMEDILGKVLDSSGAYSVEREGDYIVNRDSIQVSVSGNWLVFKDNSLKNAFVVNLIEDDASSMPDSFKKYLSDMGLTVVDIQKENPAGAGPKHNSYRGATDYHTVQPQPMIVTDLVFGIIGKPYTRDYNTKIFQNMYSGFSLEVLADRMFEKEGGQVCLIDFHGLPKRITGIIRQQGIELLQIQPDEELSVIVKKVLDFTGSPYRPSPVAFQYDRGGKSTVKLTIPGILIQTQAGDVLMTQVTLSESIIQFLGEMDVKIIKY